MLELLSSGRGVNVDTFDGEGYRSLAELYEEINSAKDLRLFRTEDDEIQEVRFGVRVSITVGHTPYYEIGRRFRRNKKILWKLKDHTASESRHIDEIPIDTAWRCVKEEVGVEVDPSLLRLRPRISEYLHHGGDEISIHRSSVYPGIRAITFFRVYDLNLPEAPPRLSRRFNILPDTGSHNYVMRVD